MIAAGRFGDIFGRRGILQLGIALFTVFSVVAALAPGVEVLIAGRGLMGIGAALILPATLALIPPQFSGRDQLTAFGVWQAVAWGGQAIAPAIGGIITDTLGWSWLFWINLPLGVTAYPAHPGLHAGIRATPRRSRRIDWVGAGDHRDGASSPCCTPCTDGPSAGWSSPLDPRAVRRGRRSRGGLGVQVERHVKDPLVDLALFRLRAYDGALLGQPRR